MSQTRYRDYFYAASKGLVHGTGTSRVVTYQNTANSEYQQLQIATPTTIDANATYTVRLAQTAGSSPFQLPGLASVATGATAPSRAAFAAALLEAIQSSQIAQMMDPVLSGTSIILNSTKLGDAFALTIPTNGTTTNDLTASELQASSVAGRIGFGLLVVQMDSDGRLECRLPTSNSNVREVLGISVAIEAIERVGIADATTTYEPNTGIEVYTYGGTTEGIDVAVDSLDLDLTGSLYIDCNQVPGRITSVATNNLALPDRFKIVGDVIPDVNGEPTVRIYPAQ